MSTSVSTVEREIKLATPPGFRLPPLTDPGGGVFASPETTATLTATYYDTADPRVTRAGASLRYRDPEGWTVKRGRPDDDDEVLTRDEYHLTGDAASPPDAAVDLVRSLTRGAPILPAATLRTVRTTVTLHDAQGRSLHRVLVRYPAGRWSGLLPTQPAALG